jgi:hypothetical protein
VATSEKANRVRAGESLWRRVRGGGGEQAVCMASEKGHRRQ